MGLFFPDLLRRVFFKHTEWDKSRLSTYALYIFKKTSYCIYLLQSYLFKTVYVNLF